jgi:hypothetical protein
LVALALSYHANAADPADSSPMQRALQALPKEIAVSAGGDFRNATIADVQADHVCLMLGPDPALEKVMREAKIERESQPFKRCYPFSSIVWWNSSTEGRPAFRLAGL